MCYECAGITPPPYHQHHPLDEIITELLHKMGHREDLYCQNLVVQDNHCLYLFWECGRKMDIDYEWYLPEWKILTWDRYDSTERHILYIKKENASESDYQADSSKDMVIVNHLEWTETRESFVDELQKEKDEKMEEEALKKEIQPPRKHQEDPVPFLESQIPQTVF